MSRTKFSAIPLISSPAHAQLCIGKDLEMFSCVLASFFGLNGQLGTRDEANE